jgi:hypothetical protein
LRALGGKSAVSTEDDVDNILRILEVLSPRLITFIIVLLVLSLSYLGKGWGIERLVEADALEERVSRLRVHRTLFLQDFLKLCVIVPQLLAMRIALNGRDFLV